MRGLALRLIPTFSALLSLYTVPTAVRAAFSTGMEWRCSDRSNDGLVDNLVAGGMVEGKEVEAALRAVDRADFCAATPYGDHPVPIGYGATISAPHMHAHALSLLVPVAAGADGPARVLDVGCGSGYLAVVLRLALGAGTKVVGIDRVPQLVELSVANTRRHHGGLLDSGDVEFRVGDGYAGVPGHTFHAIHVGAAAPAIPKPLLEQLAVGGRLVIPVGPDGGDQALVQVTHVSAGEFERKVLMGVRYVPLLPDVLPA